MTLTTYGGKIAALDMQKRQITIQEKDGSIRMGRWSEHNTNVQGVMEKLQVGYFKSITGEVQDDIMKIESASFFDKAGFPQTGGNYQKSGYSGPRSDPVVIARQSSLKVSADVYLKGINGTTPDYIHDLKEIIKGAEILTQYVTTGKVPE